MRIQLISMAAFFLSLTSSSFAETTSKADLEAGKATSVTCAACHGPDGNSPLAMYPKIAGQSAQYLERQLHMFQNGGRMDPIMQGMAAPLSAQDIINVSAYFSTQAIKHGVAEENQVELGQQIYRGGSKAGVPACMACHSPDGSGNSPAGYPALSGQHADYIVIRLNQFRSGTIWGKGTDTNSVMAGVAKNMTDEEIAAVSSYIQGLH